MPGKLIIAMLALGLACGQAAAHDGTQHGAQVTAASAGPVLHLTAAVDPDAAVAPTLPVAPGARVELTLVGGGDLHLHAFGIEAQAQPGKPAVLVFDALQPGRFPVEMHVEDALLGSREKAVLYIEVQAP